MADKLGLLREAAALFREYERHHRAKITESGRPEKAERNRDIAERIEAALATPPDLAEDRAGMEHAPDCQSHIVDVRGRPDDCTCGAALPQHEGREHG